MTAAMKNALAWEARVATSVIRKNEKAIVGMVVEAIEQGTPVRTRWLTASEITMTNPVTDFQRALTAKATPSALEMRVSSSGWGYDIVLKVDVGESLRPDEAVRIGSSFQREAMAKLEKFFGYYGIRGYDLREEPVVIVGDGTGVSFRLNISMPELGSDDDLHVLDKAFKMYKGVFHRIASVEAPKRMAAQVASRFSIIQGSAK